jgi:hypothetical protein
MRHPLPWNQMPRHNRGSRFKMWCRTYFKGRRHLARDAWFSAHFIGWNPRADYPAELRKAHNEVSELSWKNRRLTEEIAQLRLEVETQKTYILALCRQRSLHK